MYVYSENSLMLYISFLLKPLFIDLGGENILENAHNEQSRILGKFSAFKGIGL